MLDITGDGEYVDEEILHQGNVVGRLSLAVRFVNRDKEPLYQHKLAQSKIESILAQPAKKEPHWWTA